MRYMSYYNLPPNHIRLSYRIKKAVLEMSFQNELISNAIEDELS
jgi:hypothetical protein